MAEIGSNVSVSKSSNELISLQSVKHHKKNDFEWFVGLINKTRPCDRQYFSFYRV
jgi:hypothetical protein